ncbi:MAG: M48 family metallopeptidase [Bacteroidota bacterium]
MHTHLDRDKEFKRQAVKAVMAIVFFVLVYLLLVAFAIGLTLLCGYLGISLIGLGISAVSLLGGLGLIGLGLLVLIFVLKFIFTKHSTDRSGLTEISRDEEPRLFGLIEATAKATKTSLPKKVYLSPDVNACVFYDSSFWSMFLPVRKNLQIGLGLVNSVNEGELKAILAHEFGHFSQRSMKIGSYVYNVNQVIFNMLYDNQSYQSLVGQWASASQIFTLFALIGIKIIECIQWILRQVYSVVNLSYMALSREMEFHADEVAARAAGSQPLITSLLRIDLAEHAYNSVLEFYNDKVEENIRTENIFPQQSFAMMHTASAYKVNNRHGLPDVTEDIVNSFNPSRIEIKNQWASHPAVTERTRRLRELNVEMPVSTASAWNLFTRPEEIQKKISARIFEHIPYKTPRNIDAREFETLYTEHINKYAFHSLYNGFYDNRDISVFDLQKAASNTALPVFSGPEEIFTDQRKIFLRELNGLRQDTELLRKIYTSEVKIKTFEYDGIRYRADDCLELISRLKKTLTTKEEELKKLESAIYRFFYLKAEALGRQGELEAKYRNVFLISAESEPDVKMHAEFVQSLSFTHHELPFEAIQENMYQVKIKENKLRLRMKHFISDAKYLSYLKEDDKKAMDKYLSKEWTYFSQTAYDEQALKIMYEGVNAFHQSVFHAAFGSKKDLLDFQASLLPAQ